MSLPGVSTPSAAIPASVSVGSQVMERTVLVSISLRLYHLGRHLFVVLPSVDSTVSSLWHHLRGGFPDAVPFWINL